MILSFIWQCIAATWLPSWKILGRSVERNWGNSHPVEKHWEERRWEIIEIVVTGTWIPSWKRRSGLGWVVWQEADQMFSLNLEALIEFVSIKVKLLHKSFLQKKRAKILPVGYSFLRQLRNLWQWWGWQLQLWFDPWPGNFHLPQVRP